MVLCRPRAFRPSTLARLVSFVPPCTLYIQLAGGVPVVQRRAGVLGVVQRVHQEPASYPSVSRTAIPCRSGVEMPPSCAHHLRPHYLLDRSRVQNDLPASYCCRTLTIFEHPDSIHDDSSRQPSSRPPPRRYLGLLCFSILLDIIFCSIWGEHSAYTQSLSQHIHSLLRSVV